MNDRGSIVSGVRVSNGGCSDCEQKMDGYVCDNRKALADPTVHLQVISSFSQSWE